MTTPDIKALAQLARIELSDAEETALAKDLEAIIAFVDELATANVDLSDHAAPGVPHNTLRDDSNPHETGVYSEALLAQAPAREGTFIKVKKIL